MITKTLLAALLIGSTLPFGTRLALGVKPNGVDWDNRIYNQSTNYFSTTAKKTVEKIKVNDSDSYGGLVLTGNGNFTATYNKFIDISDNTKDDVLLEFIPIPEEIGKYDFRVVEFTIYEVANPDNYFVVVYAYDGNSGTIDKVRTRGNNQDLYGRKYIRDCDEFDFTGLAENLVGQTQRPDMPYESLKFCYDKSENALYASTVYNYADGTSAVRQIRAFDRDLHLKLYGGASAEQEAWNGFSTSQVGLKVEITNANGGSSPKIGIINIDGESLASRIEGIAPSKALANHEFPIPSPDVYDVTTHENLDYLTLEHCTRVFDENGYEISVIDNKFTPPSAGMYKVTYAAVLDGMTYAFDLGIECVSETEPFKFDLSHCQVADGGSLFKGTEVDILINAVSKLHINGTKALVTSDLYRDGALVDSFTNDENYHFVADEYGEYQIVSHSKDYIGREIDNTIDFSVLRTLVNFVDPNQESIVVDITEARLAFDKRDLIVRDFFDNVLTESKDFTSYDLELSYQLNDGDYTVFTSPHLFDEVGLYHVKYRISYTVSGDPTVYRASIIKTIDIVDNIGPVFVGENVITGAKENVSKTDLGASWYKATLNKEITVNKEKCHDLIYGGSREITDIKAILVKPDEESIDISSQVANGYKFTTNKIGVYYISFSASDGIIVTNKVYAVEVRTEWMDVRFDFATLDDGIVGKEYILRKPIVTNFDGDVDDDYLLEITLSNGVSSTTVENMKFTPNEKGNFIVAYVIKKNSETHEFRFDLKVIDKTAPLIILGSYNEEGYVGYTYILPTITIKDNCDQNLPYEVFVVHGGKQQSVTGNSFVPEEAGTYKIVISATDLSKNSVTKSFEIQVKDTKPAPSKSGCGGDIITSSVILSVVALFGISLIIIKRRNIVSKGE